MSIESVGRGGLSAEQINAMVSGWHFAKESLSTAEREMLTVSEALLFELSALQGGMLRTGLRPEEAAQVAELIAKLIRAREA